MRGVSKTCLILPRKLNGIVLSTFIFGVKKIVEEADQLVELLGFL